MGFDLGIAFIMGCQTIAGAMRPRVAPVPYVCPNSQNFYNVCIEIFDDIEKRIESNEKDVKGIYEFLNVFYQSMAEKGHFISSCMRESLHFRARKIERLIESFDTDTPQVL